MKRRWQWALFVVAGLCLPAVPGINLSLLVSLLLFAGWASAWDILGGWTGQTSLGHAAFVGVGAYAAALLGTRQNFDFFSGAQVGMLLSVALAFIWGKLTFRLKGPYFTLSSIAVAEILRLIAVNERWLTGGAQGIFVSQLAEPFGIDLFSRTAQYYLALAFAALLLGTVQWLSKSRLGYQMRAVRENEASAQAAGIDPEAVKLRAFMLSGALCALGGGLYGVYLSFLEPHDMFLLPLSIQIALTAIIGGRGTVWGPPLGAALLVLSAEVFRNSFAEANLLIYGVLIVLIMLYLPQGIVGAAEQTLKRRRYQKDHSQQPEERPA